MGKGKHHAKEFPANRRASGRAQPVSIWMKDAAAGNGAGIGLIRSARPGRLAGPFL